MGPLGYAMLAFTVGNALTTGFGAFSQASEAENNSLLTQTNPAQAALEMQRQAYDTEAQAQEAQAKALMQDTEYAMHQKAREISEFLAAQNNAYNEGGVLPTSQSALDVLEYTRARGQEEIDALQRRGTALADLMNSRAAITRNEGAARLFASEADFNTQQAKARLGANQTAMGLRSQGVDSFNKGLLAILGVGTQFTKSAKNQAALRAKSGANALQGLQVP